jgi:hypothetical protein
VRRALRFSGTALVFCLGAFAILFRGVELEWINSVYKEHLLNESYLTPLRARQLSIALSLCWALLLLLGTGLWLLRYDWVWFRFRRLIYAVVGEQSQGSVPGDHSPKQSGLFIFSTLGGGVVVLTFYLSNYFLPVRHRTCLYAEDALLEPLTFIFLMMAASRVCLAAFSLEAWRKEQPGSDTGYRWVVAAYVIIAGCLAFVGLEEVSWGQRVFGWETPQFLLEANFQNETNLHNLSRSGLTLSYLFLSVMLGGLAIVTVTCQYRRWKHRLIRLVVPHPNLSILMGMTSLVLVLAALEFGVEHTNECAEELVALLALSYSIGIFKFEPLRSHFKNTARIRKIIQYALLSLLVLFSMVGFHRIYPSWCSVFRDRPVFPPDSEHTAAGILELEFGKSRTRSFFGLTGWGGDERDEYLSWVWTTGQRASIRVPLRFGTDYDMELTVEPLVINDKVQAMSVDLNGSFVATVTLKSEPATYRVVLPGKLVKEVNKIDFDFTYWVSPYSLGISSDRRSLAVRFFKAKFVVLDKKHARGRAAFDNLPNTLQPVTVTNHDCRDFCRGGSHEQTLGHPLVHPASLSPGYGHGSCLANQDPEQDLDSTV